MVSSLKEALELMSTSMLTVRVPGAAARQIRTADRPGPPLERGQCPSPRVQHARSSPPRRVIATKSESSAGEGRAQCKA